MSTATVAARVEKPAVFLRKTQKNSYVTTIGEETYALIVEADKRGNVSIIAGICGVKDIKLRIEIILKVWNHRNVNRNVYHYTKVNLRGTIPKVYERKFLLNDDEGLNATLLYCRLIGYKGSRPPTPNNLLTGIDSRMFFGNIAELMLNQLARARLKPYVWSNHTTKPKMNENLIINFQMRKLAQNLRNMRECENSSLSNLPEH